MECSHGRAALIWPPLVSASCPTGRGSISPAGLPRTFFHTLLKLLSYNCYARCRGGAIFGWHLASRGGKRFPTLTFSRDRHRAWHEPKDYSQKRSRNHSPLFEAELSAYLAPRS